MLEKYIFAGCLALLVYVVSGEYGCPPPEDIVPCTCEETYYTDLKCRGIFEVDKLLSVFQNAERYHFNKFTLKNSSLQYIPHVIFNNVEVKTMDFDDVAFMRTFDVAPSNPGVETVYINKVLVRGGWDWSHLRLFTQLKELNIDFVPLRKLSTTFQPNISKGLRKLRLNWCDMKRFRDNEFAAFTELTEFASTHDLLTTVKRSMFATPSKLESLSFEYNRLTSIPEDLFTDMPNLIHLSLGNNQIAVLPEKAFRPLYDRLLYLHVHDNKLKCDCLMYWLISHKPQVLSGRCESPKKLHGKELSNLQYGDFRC